MSVELFKQFVEEHSLDIEPVRSEKSTSTAKKAAKVHRVPVSNIVKSLVIKAGSEFLVCLCPGDKRLDFERLKESLGKREVRMATPSEVKRVTGHSIGGVPPFGHKKPLKTIIIDGFDPDQPLWAAAGAPNVNFQTDLSELKRILALQESQTFSLVRNRNSKETLDPNLG